ncbi:MAG TPA: DUF4010 domain-containing protein [Pseudolabrys sp.]|nr:DUF4010 domain-containing protein [Pseudolabrys sp.]
MELAPVLSHLAVALGIGLLFGLERGWKTREVTPGSRAAGIRTFALCGLLGGIAAALAQATGNAVGAGLVLGLSFAVYAGIAAVFERAADRAADSYSATTMVAIMLTFLLGAFAVIGDTRAAGAAAVAATGILAAREEIHGWVARITWEELRSALILLAMTFIVLPVLPDTVIGPPYGINPRQLWLIAIVLAGVSFLGYAAVKAFGAERGVLLGALAGGLVSSTAVTMTSARRAAAGEGTATLLVAGTAIASGVSFLRVLAIAAVLKPELLRVTAPPLLAATAAACAYAVIAVAWRMGDGERGQNKPVEFKNPFSFWPVVGYALFLGAVIVLGRLVGDTYGARGALIGAVVVGLGDVDSITVAMTRLVPAPLGVAAAGAAILAAVASNMLSKLVAGGVIGRGRFAVELTVMTAACYVAALAALWATILVTGR